jgi:hypothetical protein
MKQLLFIITTIFVLGACAPSHFVKPLPWKQHAVTASLGGAMLKVPDVATIPIPNTTLGYGYGLKQDLTIYGNLYPTAAIFGVFQIDAGCTLQFWKQKNMGATVSPGINFLFDRFEKNAGLWPQLDANFYWNYFERKTSSGFKDGASHLSSSHVDRHTNFFYVGFSNWFQLKGTMTLGLKQENRLVFSPQVGHTFERGHWNYNLEVKFLTPYLSNQNIIIDYVSPFGKRGGLGAFFSVTYRL